MTRIALILALLLAAVLAFPPAPPPVMANPGSQDWYLTDFTSGVSGAHYIMYGVSGNGTIDALSIAKNTSKVWAADQASNIACRMGIVDDAWSVTLYADGEGNSVSSLTVDIGVLSGGSFTSGGTSPEQTVAKAGGTLSFTVVLTSALTINPGEYLAIRVNCTSAAKGFDLDVLGATTSPCYVTSPATADDYPGTVTISFTITDNGDPGVDFGSLDGGLLDQPELAQNGTGALTLQVGSDTNVPINIQLKGDDFSGPNTFLLSSADVQYDDDNTLDEGTETGLAQGTLTTSYQTWYSVAAYTADTVECYHWISVPSGQTGGNYISTFYYQAVPQ